MAACDRGPKRAPAIGEAFVGPHSLPIRTDVTQNSKGLASLQHGERVEILQQKRRVVKVRTAKGIEGWVDERQLLAASDMAELRDLAAAARVLPSQGKVTTYTDLNVHTQPSRQAPSFVQLKEGGAAEVLLYRMLPRTDARRKPLIPPPPKREKKASPRKPAKAPQVPPPPMPKPPSPPEDWLEMSNADLAEEGDDPPAETKAAAPEVPIERWSLIRMPNGAAGWVLTRLISMAVPDEVVQHAEGKRIVFYAPLGAPHGEEKKTAWVWTTASAGQFPWDFDAVRVFIYNNRKKRYETSYIDRKITGFLPVLMMEVEWQGRKLPGFSLCVLDKQEKRVRRQFAFVENRVRSAGETACEAPPPVTQKTPGAAPLPLVPPPPQQPAPGTFERFRNRVKTAVRGIFGG